MGHKTFRGRGDHGLCELLSVSDVTLKSGNGNDNSEQHSPQCPNKSRLARVQLIHGFLERDIHNQYCYWGCILTRAIRGQQRLSITCMDAGVQH